MYQYIHIRVRVTTFQYKGTIGFRGPPLLWARWRLACASHWESITPSQTDSCQRAKFATGLQKFRV